MTRRSFVLGKGIDSHSAFLEAVETFPIKPAHFELYLSDKNASDLAKQKLPVIVDFDYFTSSSRFILDTKPYSTTPEDSRILSNAKVDLVKEKGSGLWRFSKMRKPAKLDVRFDFPADVAFEHFKKNLFPVLLGYEYKIVKGDIWMENKLSNLPCYDEDGRLNPTYVRDGGILFGPRTVDRKRGFSIDLPDRLKNSVASRLTNWFDGMERKYS